MRLVYIFFILCLTTLLSAQKMMSFVIAQDVALTIDELYYTLYLHSEAIGTDINLTENPLFIQVAIHDMEGNEKYRTQVKLSDYQFTGKINLETLKLKGANIISATIYMHDMTAVLVEEALVLHILDEAQNTHCRFESSSPVIAKDGRCAIEPNATQLVNYVFENNNNFYTRDKVCVNTTNESSYLMAANMQYQINMGSSAYYQAATLQGYQTEYCIPYVFASSLAIGGGFYNTIDKQFFQFKNTLDRTKYLLQIQKPFTTMSGQFLDLSTLNAIPTPSQAYPTPKWKSLSIVKNNFPNAKDLYKKLETVYLLNHVLNTGESAPTDIVAQAKVAITPDRIFEMSNYPQFEDLHLFLFEAVPAVRSSKKGGVYDLRVLNSRNKTFFGGPPLALLNGKIVPIEEIYTLPYKDIRQINIYKELSTTRALFGSAAKFGVIELLTKVDLNALSNESSSTIAGQASASQPMITSYENLALIRLQSPIFQGTSSTSCFEHNDDTGSFLWRLYNASGMKGGLYNVSLRQ